MLAGLIPTVIILALYVSFSPPCPGEESHLLRGIKTSEPTVYRRKHLAWYTAVTVFIFSAGASVWWISSNRAEAPERWSKKHLEWRIQIIDWLSAILYCEFLAFVSPVQACTLIVFPQWVLRFHR